MRFAVPRYFGSTLRDGGAVVTGDRDEKAEAGAEAANTETLSQMEPAFDGEAARGRQDYALAEPRLRESLALSRRVGDRFSIANSLNTLGQIAQTRSLSGDVTPSALRFLDYFQEARQRSELQKRMQTIGKLEGQMGKVLERLGVLALNARSERNRTRTKLPRFFRNDGLRKGAWPPVRGALHTVGTIFLIHARER